MQRPFQAYEGDESYVFVCYSHDDKALVYPEITRLTESGIRIWYDEGIAPGSEWSETLAQHIDDCALFLYLVTPNSVASEHCRHEVNYALEEKRPILAVHLKQTEVPRGLRLSLNARQAILKYEHPRDVYEAKLSRAIQGGLANDFDDPKVHSALKLGDWTLDVGAQRLTNGSETHDLDAKAQSVLLHLVDRAPEVVSREGLITHTWPGVVVGDNVLDQAITQLRRAFGDDPRKPRYVETLHKRGYRLVAEVLTPQPTVQSPEPTRRRSATWLWVSTGVVTVALIAAWLLSRPQPIPAPKIFVAPLANQSNDEALDYMAEGLRDELIQNLSAIPTVSVSRSDDPDGYRVFGSLEPDGAEGLTIALQLARSGRTVWTRTFTAPRDDRIRNRVEVAEIATETIFAFISEESTLASSNENAKLAILRGLSFLHGGSGWGAQDSAQGYFDQAIRLDPELPAGYGLKAGTYIGAVNAYFGGIDPREGYAEARALADQALELDPDNVRTLALDVKISRFYGDWERVERTVERILDLTQTPPEFLAEHFRDCGRYDDALRVVDRAILRAEPVNSGPRLIKAVTLLYARRYAEAKAILDDVLATQPDNPRANQHMGVLLELDGRVAEAVALFGLPVQAQTVEDFGRGWLQMAQAAEQGNIPVPPAKVWRFYVMGHARLGEHAKAVEWMEKGWAAGDRHEFLAMRSYPYPGFDAMRATPEYQAMINRTIGHPPTCPGYVPRSLTGNPG